MKLCAAVCGIVMLCSTLVAQTAPPELKCGTPVVANLTLTSDLNCPSLAATGAALMILKSGVRVDLNGHTIQGGGNGIGILVPGADNVEVLNGEVRGFGFGVMVVAAGPDRSYSPVLRNLRLAGNLMGALLDAVRFGEVSGSEVSENKAFGIVLFNGTDHTSVSENLVYANARGGIVVGCDPWTQDPTGGAAASCDNLQSNDNIIEGNTVIANGWTKGTAADGLAGIILMFANRNVVRDNFIIDHNTIVDGGQLNVTSGILLTAGSDNVIVANRATNNGKGILVTNHPSVPPVPAVNSLITGNTVMHNASSGIMVYGDNITGVTISDNVAVANGYVEKTGWPVQCRSGIRVRSAGPIVIGNRAYDNVSYGLHVESTDVKAQFGNRAMRNGDPAGCLGVTCQ